MKGEIDRMDAGYGRCRPCQSHGNPVENALRFPPAFHSSLEKHRGFRPGSFPQGLGKPRGGLGAATGFPHLPQPRLRLSPPKRTGKRQRFSARWKQGGIGSGRGHF